MKRKLNQNKILKKNQIQYIIHFTGFENQNFGDQMTWLFFNVLRMKEGNYFPIQKVHLFLIRLWGTIRTAFSSTF